MAPRAHSLEPDPDAFAGNEDPARHGLLSAELLALQHVARGYTLAQIAHLTAATDAGGVVALLRRAAEALGAYDAVVAARERGLIV